MAARGRYPVLCWAPDRMWVNVDFLWPLPPRTRNRFATDLLVFNVCLHRRKDVMPSGHRADNRGWCCWLWFGSCSCSIVPLVGVAVHDRPTNVAVLVYNNDDDDTKRWMKLIFPLFIIFVIHMWKENWYAHAAATIPWSLHRWNFALPNQNSLFIFAQKYNDQQTFWIFRVEQKNKNTTANWSTRRNNNIYFTGYTVLIFVHIIGSYWL